MTTEDADRLAAAKFLQDSTVNLGLPAFPEPSAAANAHLREAQNAIRAAITSSTDAIAAAALLNRVGKLSAGKAVRGEWTTQAQDSLRAAILFAGAGLDRSLKSLVEIALPQLLTWDADVRSKFIDFSAKTVTNKETQGIDPKEFVTLFLSTGNNPEAVLLARWVRELTDGSAQSAERVEELASALGVTESNLRSRIKPNAKTPTPLQEAFTARNLIAHELDVTKPSEQVRQRLENIRQRRKASEVIGHVTEMLTVAQEIANNVAARVDAAFTAEAGRTSAL